MAAGDQHLELGCSWHEPKHLAHRIWQSPPWLGGNRNGPDPRVSFLICGTQKAGTTALADYLRGHPQLFVPEQKELHHFDNESLHWGTGIRAQRRNARRYHQAFDKAPTGRLWGEATPIYMYWDAAPERIWHYNPAMRILVLLRNPIERAYSHWAMEVARGADPLGFEDALNQEAERCRSALPLQHRVFSYVDRGFYSGQLRRLWRFFGNEAVLVLRQDHLRQAPQRCLDGICQHLGVDPFGSVEPLEQHVGRYGKAMDPNIRERLRGIFANEIQQLEAMLGWDCSDWLEG